MRTHRTTADRTPRVALVALLAGLAIAGQAGEVYRWVDDQGRVHFQDRERDGAEKVELDVHTVTTVTVSALEKLEPDQGEAEADDRLTLYMTQWCGYCKKARRYFQRQGIPFTEKDIEASSAARREYERYGGTGGVPLIVQGRRTMKGFSVADFKRFYRD